MYSLDNITEEFTLELQNLPVWECPSKQIELITDYQSPSRLFNDAQKEKFKDILGCLTANSLKAIIDPDQIFGELGLILFHWRSENNGFLTYTTRELDGNSILELADSGAGLNTTFFKEKYKLKLSDLEILDFVFEYGRTSRYIPAYIEGHYHLVTQSMTGTITSMSSETGVGLFYARRLLQEYFGGDIQIKGTSFFAGNQLVTVGEYDKNHTGTIVEIKLPH